MPSPAVSEALLRAQQHEIRVALCTGRPMASCGKIALGLGLAGPHVAFNGALVKDPRQAGAVFRRPLPPADLDRLIELSRAEDVCLELYTEATHFVERDWRESRLHAISIRVSYELADFDDFFGRTDVVKGQIITADERAHQATRRIGDSLAGRLRFSVAIPMAPCEGMECVNVVEDSVSKASAVRALIDYYGVSREQVAGVGDALNDLPMLAEVGWRVAMGNAEAPVKAEADYVCPGVEEDGLVAVVNTII